MLVSLTTALTGLALAVTAPQSPQWEADYGKALAQTRADSRPLLIVIDNPKAENKALTPELLGADAGLLASYDLCRVDASTKYGKKVAEAFEAKAFPYVAIIDKTGSVILHSRAGAVSSDAWKATLNKYQAGEQPIRFTAAKPVVVESNTPAQPTSYIESAPVYYTPSYGVPADCPNCRRGY